jgi:hypothetical protein
MRETARRLKGPPSPQAPLPAGEGLREPRRLARGEGRSFRLGFFTAAALACFLSACSWNPTRPFERNAPAVDQAIAQLDAGEAGAAAQLLETFLQTGACTEGQLGTPDRVREMHNGTFDLGLTLFHLAEKYGHRFGEEDVFPDGGQTPEQQTEAQLRSDQVECALKVLHAISSAADVPIDLRARAHYLEGNLEFLRRSYKAAVEAYDESLKLIPGLPEDAGDAIGRDAAWNRAVALRRIEDEKNRDAGKDADQDQAAPDAGSPDGPQDGPQDGPPDANEGKPEGGPPDGGSGDDGGKKDAEPDGPSNEPQNQQPEAGAPEGGKQPPPENTSQDDRMLDLLESAPTVQLQDAKNKASRRRGRGMVDK